MMLVRFFFSSRRRHTSCSRDWSSDVCSSDLNTPAEAERLYARAEFLYRQAGDLAGGAEAQQGRGLLLLDRDDYARARTVLEGALPTRLGPGSPPAAALARPSLGEPSHARGGTTPAPRR